MQKSRLFFILTIIAITITVVLVSSSVYYYNKAYDISGKHTFNKETEGELLWEEKFNIANEKADFLKYTSIVIGSISVIFLATGIILKIKEKGGIEIVS